MAGVLNKLCIRFRYEPYHYVLGTRRGQVGFQPDFWLEPCSQWRNGLHVELTWADRPYYRSPRTEKIAADALARKHLQINLLRQQEGIVTVLIGFRNWQGGS